MTETDPAHGQRLEALLLELKQNKQSFGDIGLGLKDFESVTRMSKFFLQLLTKSGLSFGQTDSLNVVIPGGNFFEIVGALIAARAVGFKQTLITSVENNETAYGFNRSKVFEIFRKGAPGERTSVDVEGARVNLVFGEAEDLKYKMAIPNASANMVFIGNSPPDFDPIVENWSSLGEGTKIPLLFAITASDYPDEEQGIRRLFDLAKNRGRLTPVLGMEGANNPHALINPLIHRMTNRVIFAGTRK